MKEGEKEKMELHQIDNFIAAAAHQHFTNAAKERMISQPALSRSIIRLEEELGAPLFYRETKSRPADKARRAVLNKSKTSETSFK